MGNVRDLKLPSDTRTKLWCGESFAEVAELVDALASGASGGNPVEVQVLSSVPFPDFKTIWFRPRALAS